MYGRVGRVVVVVVVVVVGEEVVWVVEEEGLGVIGERVKGEVGRMREDDGGTSEEKGEDELSGSEEREGPGGCCRENEWSSRGMSMAGGNLRWNEGAELSFSDSKSSERRR